MVPLLVDLVAAEAWLVVHSDLERPVFLLEVDLGRSTEISIGVVTVTEC